MLENGNAKEGYGFYIQPHAGDLVIQDNQIADTRTDGRTQRVAIFRAPGAGAVHDQANATGGQ